MKKAFHIIPILSAVLLMSCQQETVSSLKIQEEVTEVSHYVPGKAVVKVSAALAEKLEAEGNGDGIIPGGTMKRTFQPGGKYEKRMRKEGLHLWYNVEFDESVPLTKAGDDLRDIEGIELVEYVPAIKVHDETPVFNDPELKKQWHYKNAGNVVTGLQEGCDINVTPAWERGIVGNENVIVAVIDSGVDVAHEDLKDNIWQGTDDKGNIINGYNAFQENHKINPEDHGTHVAGTIAAVNNNGIGVSGIAGGDAAAGKKGVKIMSCVIFDGDHMGNEAQALVWAADNGAVIAQNSWGYLSGNNLKDTPEYTKKAIDYFVKYAGCDEDGNQLPDSPMKGGVAIFASGNDGLPVGYPASYENCVAVSSVAGDYEMAYYSNFGDWVDIMAPGGDTQKNQMVLSTVPNNSYDRMQGTSMACPHVSGVAALIVSEFGGPGFTREDLIDRLLKTASDISLPANEMGHGLVNASAAVAHYGEFKPNVPGFAKYEELSGTALTLKYIMPEDNNGVECRNVEIYWSETPFEQISESMNKRTIATGIDYNAGDTLAFTVDGLAENTEYHFSVMGIDVLDYTSELSENISITTRGNLPPEIVALDGTEHTFKQYMWTKLKFKINDPEKEEFEVKYENATDAESFYYEDGMYYLVIDSKLASAGSYSSRIIATDARGNSSECNLAFVIEENTVPVLSAEMENMIFSSKSVTKKVTLSNHIADADGEELTYKVISSDENVVKVSVMRGEISLTSAGFGDATVTVTATDAMATSVQTSFRVVVRDGSREFDLYPNPVTDGKLHIRASNAAEADVKIISSSGAVVYENKVIPDPFNPAVEDVSGLAPGVYNVKVTNNLGKVFTQNIVVL